MTAHDTEREGPGIAPRRPAGATGAFSFSATSPTPLVRDFDVFLDALADPTVSLTKSLRTLDRATLHRVDALMQTHRTDTHPRTDQMYHPLLNLFQRISAAERLFAPEIRGGKMRPVATDRLAAYRNLNEAERWMALLDAFWVRCDWQEILPRGCAHLAAVYGADMFMDAVVRLGAGRETRVGDASRGGAALQYLDSSQHYLLFLFSLFGLIDCALAPPREIRAGLHLKGDVVVRSFTITSLGAKVLRILHRERPRDRWNLPLRMELGAPQSLPGESALGIAGGPAKPSLFREAFLPLFPAGAVGASLPKIRLQRKAGTFLFKVSLGSGVWRTLALSDRHTLEDLHLAIQKGFGFDNDHLYAFHLDGRRHSRMGVYHDSRCEQPPFADEADLGGLDIHPGQEILYLFDFGAGWEFGVKLVEISDEPMRGHPRIVEGKGENPEQYPDFDAEG